MTTTPEKPPLRDRIAQHLAAREGRPGDWIGYRDQADEMLVATVGGPELTLPRPHPLLGYAVGHVLSDEGPVEWFEDDNGQTALHLDPDAARRAAPPTDADPQTWPVIELRLVPEGGA